MKTIVGIATISLVFFGSFLFPISVSAQTRIENAQERADNYIENRCERVSFNIDNRIERYNENKDRHINRYNNIQETVANTIEKLKEQDVDVSKLEQDLDTLNQYIKDFASSYSTFISMLEESKTYACGNSEGEFRNQVEEARTQLIKTRDIATDIINFTRLTIREDLEQIRNSI